MLPGGRAASPLSGGLAGGKGLGLAPPVSGGAQGAAVGPSRGRFGVRALVGHAHGVSILMGAVKTSLGFGAGCSCGASSTVVQGAACCPLAPPLCPPSLMCHRPQLVFWGPKKTPWGI